MYIHHTFYVKAERRGTEKQNDCLLVYPHLPATSQGQGHAAAGRQELNLGLPI